MTLSGYEVEKERMRYLEKGYPARVLNGFAYTD